MIKINWTNKHNYYYEEKAIVTFYLTIYTSEGKKKERQERVPRIMFGSFSSKWTQAYQTKTLYLHY